MGIRGIDTRYPVRKMHGAGNDFIVLSDPDCNLTGKEAALLCRRHFGIGADGLIAAAKSRVSQASFRMKFFNPDGTTAEMCGNGIRCFAKYLADNGFISGTGPVSVDTDAGIVVPELVANTARLGEVRVNMGPPVFHDGRQVAIMPGTDGLVRGTHAGLGFTFIGMGNPHCVIFSGDPDADVLEYGPVFEGERSIFPQKTNVEFVKVLNPGELVMRVWERGAGRTLACGTGACASLVAASAAGKCSRTAVVHLSGGDLKISWQGGGEPVFMTGPAANVCDLSFDSLVGFLEG